MKPEVPAPDTVSDPIQQIAESLIGGAEGNERLLLSKSLQETLFYCVGFNTGLRYSESLRRIRQFLAREGSAVVLQRFLALHFFNFVWFQIGESFRSLAWTPAAFERDMETVEMLCQKAVTATWKASGLTDQPLSLPAARQLVRTIEERLRAGV